MNKFVQITCFFTLVLSLANLALLLQMGGRMQEMKEKIDPLARSVEQVQPVLEQVRQALPGDPAKKGLSGPPVTLDRVPAKPAGPGPDLFPPPPFAKQ